MKRVTQKMLTEFIAKVADKKPSNIVDDNAMCYYSKIDGSYIGRVGVEDHLKFLLKKGITEQIQNKDGIADHSTNIGFNPEEKKWYGWSHRAIYGFTIGSTCKKGDCHYQPCNKKDFIDDCTRFWSEEDHLNTISVDHVDEGIQGVLTSWTYTDTIPNKELRSKISTVFTFYPETYGKGEWVAKTMEDAKQMAKDFAEGVG